MTTTRAKRGLGVDFEVKVFVGVDGSRFGGTENEATDGVAHFLPSWGAVG